MKQKIRSKAVKLSFAIISDNHFMTQRQLITIVWPKTTTV